MLATDEEEDNAPDEMDNNEEGTVFGSDNDDGEQNLNN